MQKNTTCLKRSGLVTKKDIASWCFVRDINSEEITFISDVRFKKGDKINIQLSKNDNSIKKNFFITAVIKKKPIQISGTGNLNYAWVC